MPSMNRDPIWQHPFRTYVLLESQSLPSLLFYAKIYPLDLLANVLTEFAGQVVDLLQCSFRFTEGLSRGNEGDFDQELLIVEVLHNLVSLSSRLQDADKDLEGNASM